MEPEHHQMVFRFYEKEYPDEEDLVMGKVVEVEENATYLDLLEYPGKQGMITPGEYTRSLQRVNIQKALRKDKDEIVRVIRVDKDKGYIDLSKKKVHKQEEIDFRDRFAKTKTLNSIMRTIAQHLKCDIYDVMKKIAWPLYRQSPQPLQILIEAMVDESKLDSLGLDQPTKAKLMSEIKRRFQPPRVKIMATFEISINDFEGINILKEALTLGQNKSKPEFKIQITILGAPVYLIALQTDKCPDGINLINEALTEMKNFIQARGGSYKTKEAPKVIGDRNQHIEQLIQESNKNMVAVDSDDSGMGSASGDDQ